MIIRKYLLDMNDDGNGVTEGENRHELMENKKQNG